MARRIEDFNTHSTVVIVEGNYYYFYTLSGVYYFGDYLNVFFHDSTLVHDGSDAPNWDDLLTPHFYLDDIPFWFDDQGLLYQDTDDDGLESIIAGTKALSGSSGASEASGSIEERQSDADVFRSGGTNDATCTRGVKSKEMEDQSLQAYPTSADSNDNKYCFRASGRLYYCDSDRRLFSKTGRLVYNGSSSFMARQSSFPNSQIDDVGYWFGLYRLLARVADVPNPGTKAKIKESQSCVAALATNPVSYGDPDPASKSMLDFDAS
ncbi:hypothetical protein B0J17DRAFT_717799 [Rhizoctonia solani]|nr:hypothetical protein B0J17DRAFT_717799 [Rhizoctonia solani]